MFASQFIWKMNNDFPAASYFCYLRLVTSVDVACNAFVFHGYNDDN
jgi:hypothetical protein